MARRRFSGKGYFTLQQTENAIRAEAINAALDRGERVFGDDGPDAEGEWHEIEEALEPGIDGILVKTKADRHVKVYSRDSTPERAAAFDARKSQ